MRRRQLVHTAVMVTASPAAVLAQGGAPWPSRPIRLVVPYSAGGGSDVQARLLGQALSPMLGQPVLIENRVGAGSQLGTEHVARSTPDGHTLLFADVPLVIVPAVMGVARAGYDPIRDFAPVSLVGTAPPMLWARAAAPFADAAGFVSAARAAPGRHSVASSGAGSSSHLTAELFQQKTGIRLVHLPYRGSAPALTDVAAGQVDTTFASLSTGAALLQAGAIKSLGVASRERLPQMPELRTFAEQGIDLVTEHWWGVIAPAGTPGAVVARLGAAIGEALRAPALVERFAAVGIGARPSSAEEFAALITSESARWSEVVRAAGVQPG